MAKALQYLQHRARQLQRAFDRLVGIGVGTELQRMRDIAGLAQFALQLLGNVGLEDELGFEVQARGIAQIGHGSAGHSSRCSRARSHDRD